MIPWYRLLFACLFALVGCGAPAPPAPGADDPAPEEPLPFQEVAARAGLSGFRVIAARGEQTNLLDTVGCGAAVLDADGDRLVDLVLTGPDRVTLFRNRGNFQFEAVEAGFRQPGRWAGLAVGDVNNDGCPDLFVNGYGSAALYLNEGGRYREVTDAQGLTPPVGKTPLWGTSAGFADLDRDGWVDLVVCRYVDFGADQPQRCPTMHPGVTAVCSPEIYSPQRPRVFRNLQGRGFQDVTDAWGVRAHGAARGVAFQDADGDGFPEIAFANDRLPHDFFVRQGAGYVERGAESATGYDREGRVHGGAGLDWADVDRDGRPDLTVMTSAGEDRSLYRNLGGNLFEEVGWRWGLTGEMRMEVTFGGRFLDYDNDGWSDLVLASGHIQENAERVRPGDSYEQPVRLFRSNGFSLTPVGPEMWPRAVGRALATADFDNDGGMDFVVTTLSGPPLLFRNVGPRGNWIGLHLEGTRANRMAIGARVMVRTPDHVRVAEVQTAGSYMAAHDSRLLIGVGRVGAVESVTVRWSGGKEVVIPAPALNTWTRVREQ